MSASRYQDLLNNPFYYGLFRLHGELHQGAHEPLITKQLFDECQAVMRRRSRPDTPRLKSYVYRGLLHCGECGCGITMETQKGHNYLRCTKRMQKGCSQKYLREEKLTEQIAGVLDDVSLPDDTAEWMVTELKTQVTARPKNSEPSKNKPKARLRSSICRSTASRLHISKAEHSRQRSFASERMTCSTASRN